MCNISQAPNIGLGMPQSTAIKEKTILKTPCSYTISAYTIPAHTLCLLCSTYLIRANSSIIMTIYLYQVETNEYPENIADPESLMLVHEEDQSPDNIDFSTFNFLTTLTLKCDVVDDILEEFKAWWQENVGSEVGLELITKDSRRLKAERQQELQDIDENTWSLDTTFIAYPRDSEGAYLSAQDTIQAMELVVSLNS